MVRCIGVGRGRVDVAGRREGAAVRAARAQLRRRRNPRQVQLVGQREPARQHAARAIGGAPAPLRPRHRSRAASAGPVGGGRDRGVPRDARRRGRVSRTTSATSIQNTRAAERSVLARRQPVGPRRRSRRRPCGPTSPTGDGSVIVASIDTGVNYNHPDLAANMWRNPLEIPGNGIDDDGDGYVDDVYGIDTVNHDSNPMDDQGHGTHTAGTIAAVGNNGLGVVGVNWNAKILACKFLDADGIGHRRRRASSASTTSSRCRTAARTSACRATAGASSADRIRRRPCSRPRSTRPARPASSTSSAPATTARTTTRRRSIRPATRRRASSRWRRLDPTDRRSFFSNYGATSVDLAAPGEDILSTYLGSGLRGARPARAWRRRTWPAWPRCWRTMNPTLSVPAHQVAAARQRRSARRRGPAASCPAAG